jgi:hypothetical protein
MVGVFWEAGVVEDELRRGAGTCGEGRLLPVTADDEQCLGLFRQGAGKIFERLLRRLPSIGRPPGPIHEEAWAAAVG